MEQKLDAQVSGLVSGRGRLWSLRQGKEEERAGVSCGWQGWELAAELCLRGPWDVLELSLPGCRISGCDAGVL